MKTTFVLVLSSAVMIGFSASAARSSCKMPFDWSQGAIVCSAKDEKIRIECKRGQLEISSDSVDYSVAKQSRTEKWVHLSLNNAVDGPLVTDVLAFRTLDLGQLSDGTVDHIKIVDYYSEGFDGTHHNISMTCEIDPKK